MLVDKMKQNVTETLLYYKKNMTCFKFEVYETQFVQKLKIIEIRYI